MWKLIKAIFGVMPDLETLARKELKEAELERMRAAHNREQCEHVEAIYNARVVRLEQEVARFRTQKEK